MILPSLKHLAKPLFQSQKLIWTGRRLVSSTIEQRPERLGHVLLKAHSPPLARLPSRRPAPATKLLHGMDYYFAGSY
ncbi:hypothetical protein X761_32890 [Mesorhizobium sp. LSHC424B00]|nr:hypothetical protein X761_32890 [Mesorhizobium sp. LSHC424B00]